MHMVYTEYTVYFTALTDHWNLYKRLTAQKHWVSQSTFWGAPPCSSSQQSTDHVALLLLLSLPFLTSWQYSSLGLCLWDTTESKLVAYTGRGGDTDTTASGNSHKSGLPLTDLASYETLASTAQNVGDNRPYIVGLLGD